MGGSEAKRKVSPWIKTKTPSGWGPFKSSTRHKWKKKRRKDFLSTGTLSHSCVDDVPPLFAFFLSHPRVGLPSLSFVPSADFCSFYLVFAFSTQPGTNEKQRFSKILWLVDDKKLIVFINNKKPINNTMIVIAEWTHGYNSTRSHRLKIEGTGSFFSSRVSLPFNLLFFLNYEQPEFSKTHEEDTIIIIFISISELFFS